MTQFLPTTDSLAAHDDDRPSWSRRRSNHRGSAPHADDYAVALPGGRRLWVSHPLSVQDVPGLLEILLRGWMPDRLTTAARTCLSNNSHRQRKPRRPSLASVAKQARKAGLEVARYEVKPDNTVVVVIGKPKSAALENPWLADLKVRSNEVSKIRAGLGRCATAAPIAICAAVAIPRVRLTGLPWSPSSWQHTRRRSAVRDRHRHGPHQARQSWPPSSPNITIRNNSSPRRNLARDDGSAASLSASARPMATGHSRCCRRNGSRRCLMPSRRMPPALGS